MLKLRAVGAHDASALTIVGSANNASKRGGKTVRSCAWLVGLIASGLSSTALAETVYVQSIRAHIKAAPVFGSAEIARAQRGDALQVLAKNPGWYKVSLGRQEGWVSSLLVSPRQPLSKVSILVVAPSLGTYARRRASSITTTAAARGLAADDRRRASRAGALGYADLAKLDDFLVSDAEALSFHAALQHP